VILGEINQLWRRRRRRRRRWRRRWRRRRRRSWVKGF
jgi:hypothetical protein